MQVAADLTSNQFRRDPYSTYDRLRETEPVCRVRIGRNKFAWLVTRYDDVLAAVKDTRFTKDQQSLPVLSSRGCPLFFGRSRKICSTRTLRITLGFGHLFRRHSLRR